MTQTLNSTSVWICPECFDAYEARTASGDCPNGGHAPVRLFETPVRSLPGVGVAPAREDRRVAIAA